MDYLSSMYIDDEMDLEEKMRFVKRVRFDNDFYSLTLELLDQERLFRALPGLPQTTVEKRWRVHPWMRLSGWFKPLGFASAGFTVALLIFWATFYQPVPAICNNRFVLFEPAAEQVEITGSFTGWQRLLMQRIGRSGYWELILPVPSGEHRFAYILDGSRRLADPTLPASEKDDFGGENSILFVETRL